MLLFCLISVVNIFFIVKNVSTETTEMRRSLLKSRETLKMASEVFEFLGEVVGRRCRLWLTVMDIRFPLSMSDAVDPLFK
jgi:hypothetical protein